MPAPEPAPTPRTGSPGDGVGTPPGEGIATALGRIPSGLFVVSWREAEVDRVMLASWVMQAGFAPPSISLAIAPSRDLLAAIDRGLPFAVNVLGESQRSLLARFGKPSTPGEDPFAGMPVRRTSHGIATLETCSWIECRGVSRATAGDHVVIVAEVVGGDSPSGEPPLVHVRKNGLRY